MWLPGAVSLLALASAAAGWLQLGQRAADSDPVPELAAIRTRHSAAKREAERRESEREEARRTVQAEIEAWNRDARAAVERERAEHKDNPFVQAGERRYVEDWRLAGGQYDHLSAGLWTPAFEATGSEFWTPWFFFQSTKGGSVKELEIAYRYHSPGNTAADGPVDWAIRSSHAGPATLTYELFVDCLAACTPGWRTFALDLTGPETRHIGTNLRAYRVGWARAISLE